MTQTLARISEITTPVRELVELVMRAGAPIAAEYPLVFERGSGAAWAVIEDNGQPVSACALLPRELWVDGETLRVGLIGSVVTHPGYRGQGLASRVLQAAEQELQRRGCLLAALWAEDAEYYAARGWRAWGSEVDCVVPRELTRMLPEPLQVRLATGADATAIHRLYTTHRRRVARTRGETAQLLRIPRMDVLVRERDGEVVAYSCLGRGADLQDVVHEWAGPTVDVLALLRMHLELRATLGEHRDLFLMCSDDAELPLVAALEELGAPANRGVLGMAKLLDPRTAAQWIAQRWSRGQSLTWRASPQHAGACEFRVGARSCTLALADMQDLLVAPRGADGTARAFGRQLGLPPVAPLRPFVWGLDSI